MDLQRQRYRRWSFAVLTALVAISAFWFWRMGQLDFDYDFEKFFPVGDPETAFFQEHRARFETDNDFVLIALVNDEGIFDQGFLEEAKRLSDTLVNISNVTDVVSAIDQEYRVPSPIGGYASDNYMHIDQPEKYASDSVRIWGSPDIMGNFFSEDGTSLGIVVQHTDYLSKVKCDTLAADLEEMLTHFEFDGVHLAGRAVGQSYYVKLMESEMVIFVGTSFVLILIFLFVAFRSAWGVIVPMIVVLLATVWIIGLMSLAGKAIDVMMTVLPTIMFVVGMSDVVHILSKYLEELRNGAAKLMAIKTAFREVGAATFLTSLTTAIGFFTLMSSGVTPIMDFGIYTGIGVFIAFGLAFSMLPALMVLVKTPKIAQKRGQDKLFWNRQLHRAFRWTLRNRKGIAVGSLLVLGLSAWGISKIRMNNFLLEDLSDDDYLKKEWTFFDDRYGGVRPFEMSISMKDSTQSLLDYENLLMIDSMERWLQREMSMSTVVSPVALLKGVNRMMKGGGNQHFSLPEENELYAGKFRRQWEKILASSKGKPLITADLDTMRLTSRMPDFGSEYIREKQEAFDQFMIDYGAAEVFDYRVTGTAYLIDVNNAYLARNMLTGLLIAFGVIALIVAFLFRSFKMIVISLIPNMLPLIVVAGVMGFLDINLKVSTSIIFTIIFGIAVDDTIHFLSKLRIESRKGKTMLYAMKRTYLSTGKAIVVTSIILCAGFLTLVFSDFMGTFYTGFLIGLALFLAVIADLVLLPLLLMIFYRKNVQLLPAKQDKNTEEKVGEEV